MRGEEAPTPGQIEAFHRLITNVLEKKKSNKKKNGKPHLIKGVKTWEEIEKIIVDFLVIRKNYQSKLICENIEVHEIL